MTPLRLFRRVAIAEAVTWTLLLAGMFLKYVTATTDLGVRIGGMLHGVVFVAFCLTTLVVAVDQRWSPGRLVAGLASAVPPFATVPFDLYAERRGLLGTSWRLRGAESSSGASGPVERVVAWLLSHPVRGLLVGVAGVAALTGVALLVGPPVG